MDEIIKITNIKFDLYTLHNLWENRKDSLSKLIDIMGVHLMNVILVYVPV